MVSPCRTRAYPPTMQPRRVPHRARLFPAHGVSVLERHHVGGGGVGGRGGHLGVAAVLAAVAGQLGVGHFLALKARRRHLLALRERERGR